MRLFSVLSVMAACLLIQPAAAATLRFEAHLDGAQEVPSVDTDATGTAEVFVDTITENLFVSLDVFGITTDDLRDDFVAAPIGPVHLHLGERGVNGPIVVPFAFNSSYQDTSGGFSLTSIVSYDSSVSGLAFSEFLTALNDEGIYFNVHTDAFLAGEIRGQVVADVAPIPLPASGVLLAGALLGAWSLRRRATA